MPSSVSHWWWKLPSGDVFQPPLSILVLYLWVGLPCDLSMDHWQLFSPVPCVWMAQNSFKAKPSKKHESLKRVPENGYNYGHGFIIFYPWQALRVARTIKYQLHCMLKDACIWETQHPHSGWPSFLVAAPASKVQLASLTPHQWTIKPCSQRLLASIVLLWVLLDITTACLEPPENYFPGRCLMPSSKASFNRVNVEKCCPSLPLQSWVDAVWILALKTNKQTKRYSRQLFSNSLPER